MITENGTGRLIRLLLLRIKANVPAYRIVSWVHAFGAILIPCQYRLRRHNVGHRADWASFLHARRRAKGQT